MQLIFSLLVGFATIFCLPINAQAIEKICDPSTEEYQKYYDSSAIYMNGAFQYNVAHSLRYDITYVGIHDDKLVLHGWAIDNAVDNDLGGVKTSDSKDDTKVRLVLFPKGSYDLDRAIDFDIKYATPGNGHCSVKGCDYNTPKFYDFTYWHCLRNSAGNASYPNVCRQTDTTYLYGGFSATVDLNSIPTDTNVKQYQVGLQWTAPSGVAVSSDVTSWTLIGAASIVVDSSVEEYNANSNKNVDVSNFNSEVYFRSTQVRTVGSDGHFCSSLALENKKSKTYYKNTTYEIDSSKGISEGCRGGDVACIGAAAGAGNVLLYPLKLSQTDFNKGVTSIGRAKSESDVAISYATASWLTFKRKMLITLESEPIEPTNCPDTVEQATCVSSDTGTHAVFHENDQLKTCTIGKNNSSGFTAIELSETAEFCEMACKEDLDIYLPTAKQTAAGQYFILNNYEPKIEAKRTCVTSKTDYDKFIQNLENMEEELKKAYKVWQDYIDYYKKKVKPAEPEAPTSDVSDPKCCEGNCCNEPDCNDPTPGCSYTYQDWKIESHTGPNGTSFKIETGRDNECDCDQCGGGPVACPGPTLEEKKEMIKNEVISKRDAYRRVLENYVNYINAFNRCYSWMDIVYIAHFKPIGENYDSPFTLWTTQGIEDYKYSFEPEVIFDYEDEDNIFVNEFKNADKEGFDAMRYYWGEGAEVDEEYTGGTLQMGYGGTGLNRVERKLLNCEGQKCEGGLNVANQFYKSSHLKRTEEVKYTYLLPTVYTIIPSGVVSLNPNAGATTLQLENYAVPVSVNTLAGTYNYSITISDLKDDLREKKEPQNPDDNWEDRFVDENKPVLNGEDIDEGRFTYQDYACTYNVVNDVYVPDPSRYNFFYRTVDMSNINPTGRNLGYNWTDERAAEVIPNMEKTDADYQELTNNSNRDKFVFTLTPTIMKSIRDYNSTRTNGYSDWDLKCFDYNEGGYHCYSNFLTCLTSSGNINETGNCSEFLTGALSNYDQLSKYVYNDLKTNRDILIEKQIYLDGLVGIPGGGN